MSRHSNGDGAASDLGRFGRATVTAASYAVLAFALRAFGRPNRSLSRGASRFALGRR